MANAPVFAATIKSAAVKFTNVDGATAKTLLTAGASGSIVRSIWASSNNDVAIKVTLLYSDGATDFLVDTIEIPAASVITPIQKINFFDPYRLTKLDPNEIQWFIQGNHLFKVRVETAVTSGAYEVAAFAEWGDF